MADLAGAVTDCTACALRAGALDRACCIGCGCLSMLDDVPRIGLAICKDMDFQDIGNAYAARNAQLLLVPA